MTIDANTEVTKMLELSNKYFKAAMTKNASMSSYKHAETNDKIQT